MRNVVTLPQVHIERAASASEALASAMEVVASTSDAGQNLRRRPGSGDDVFHGSAVVRARYDDADVRGVNRYKHFHRPLVVGEGAGESIDKKMSPRRSPTDRRLRSPQNGSQPHESSGGTLPQIHPNPESEPRKFINNGHLKNGRQNNDATKGNANSKGQTPTGGVASASDDGASTKSGSPPDYLKSRRQSNQSTPPIPNGIISTDAFMELKAPPSSFKNRRRTSRETPTTTTTILPDINAKPPLQSNGYVSNARTPERTSSNQQTSLTTSASTNSERPHEMPVVEARKAELSQKKKDALIQLQQQRYVSRPAPTPASATATTKAKKTESAVQTETNNKNSTLNVNVNGNRMPKATQTENSDAIFSRRRKKYETENVLEIEQRAELLEIIDDALSETIDQQSRQLANQFIASSARQQAQVWKDAKEFVATILVPCSVELANQARSCRFPIDNAANIQLP